MDAGEDMDIGAYIYPWDVVGDPAAADRIAGLGLSHVAVAAVYHAVRALTPRHPRHRVVVAEHTAAYYPLSTERWEQSVLYPPRASWTGGTDAFGSAVGALRAAGVGVHAWAVFNHVDLPGNGEFSVVNAYGDRYPWALCPAQDAVQEYALGLAGDVVDLPSITGVELESLGWFGYEHLSAHDKTGGVPLTGAEQYLFSLCFCDGCDGAYRATGVDPVQLRARVTAVLDATFAGNRHVQPSDQPGSAASGAAQRPGPVDDEVAAIAELLGEDLAVAVAAMRDTVAERYRAAVVDRIRFARPELAVLAHANPQPHRSIAFTGMDVSRAGIFDGLVVNCWRGLDALTSTLATAEVPVLASLVAVDGMGGRPDTLAEQGVAALAAGAAGLRVYHAGLAGNAGLDHIRELTQHVVKGAEQ
jgi:hypothetical protein